jgi:hypothetical protein
MMMMMLSRRLFVTHAAPRVARTQSASVTGGVKSQVASVDRKLHALLSSGSKGEANSLFDASSQSLRGSREVEVDAFLVRWSIALSRASVDEPCALSNQNVTPGLRVWSVAGIQRLTAAEDLLSKHLSLPRSQATAVDLTTVVCDAVNAYASLGMLPEAYLVAYRCLEWFRKCRNLTNVMALQRQRVVTLGTSVFQKDAMLSKMFDNASNDEANKRRLKEIVDQTREIRALLAGKGAALQQTIASIVQSSSQTQDVIAAVESQLKKNKIAGQQTTAHTKQNTPTVSASSNITAGARAGTARTSSPRRKTPAQHQQNIKKHE